MKWSAEIFHCPGAELYSIVGEDGRMLGGEEACFLKGEAEWLVELLNASKTEPPEETT